MKVCQGLGGWVSNTSISTVYDTLDLFLPLISMYTLVTVHCVNRWACDRSPCLNHEWTSTPTQYQQRAAAGRTRNHVCVFLRTKSFIVEQQVAKTGRRSGAEHTESRLQREFAGWSQGHVYILGLWCTIEVLQNRIEYIFIVIVTWTMKISSVALFSSKSQCPMKKTI